MVLRYLRLRMTQIKTYRWICIIIFLMLVFAWSANNTKTLPIYSFVDIFVYLFSDPYLICFYTLFAIIMLSSDNNGMFGNSFEQQIIIRILPRSRFWKMNFYHCMLMSLFIVILLAGLLCIAIIVCYGFIPFSIEPTLANFGLDYVSGIEGLIWMIVLMYCRVCFINMGIYIINSKAHIPLGFFFGIIISLLDWWFYDIFQIMQPLMILPLEHTRILYTEAVAPALEGAYRISYNFSLLYWIGLIGVEAIIYRKIIMKKDFIKNI